MAQPNEELIASVGDKFTAWAQSLPEEEQEVVATWMTQIRGDDVTGFSASQWQDSGQWQSAWQSTWQDTWQG